jgi:hypothetical protein
MKLHIKLDNCNISKFIDVHGKEVSTSGVLAEIQKRGKKRYTISKTCLKAFIAACAAVFIGSFFKYEPIHYVLISIVFIYFLWSICKYLFKNYRRFELFYDLDEKVDSLYKVLKENFSKIVSVEKVWDLIETKEVKDKKYHGGAEHIIKRAHASAGYGLPKFVSKSNIEALGFSLASNDIYFFPDQIVVVDGRKHSEYEYSDLSLSVSNTRWQETDPLPRDAEVIGKTWQYVNKSGGPDKRFKDNYEIPVCAYQELHIFLPNKSFSVMLSKRGPFETFRQTLCNYVNLINTYLLPEISAKISKQETNGSKMFTIDEFSQILLGALLISTSDFKYDKKEMEISKAFMENALSHDYMIEFSSSVLEKISNEAEEILKRKKEKFEEEGRINIKKYEPEVIEIADKLNLTREKKQAVIDFYQAVVMADGFATDMEQEMLKLFIQHL